MRTDQQWPPYQAGPAAWGHPGPRYNRRRRNPFGVLLALLLTLMILGGAALAVALFVIDGDALTGSDSVDALSADGLDELRGDVEDETGGTLVFRAVVYPDRASVDLPVDADSQRQETFNWDGALDDLDLGTGGKGTSTLRRVDLAAVDADVVLETVAEAKSLVQDPETWYAIIAGPAKTEKGGATITVHASNEFGESAYVEVNLKGKEVGRSDSGT